MALGKKGHVGLGAAKSELAKLMRTIGSGYADVLEIRSGERSGGVLLGSLRSRGRGCT